jgi:signal transduction histidine kinase
MGFAAFGAAPLTLLSAMPALAQTANVSSVLSTAPLAIALGAGGFGLLALLLLRKVRRDGQNASERAGEQISNLRALVDEYEALLSASREVTILWSENAGGIKMLGQTNAILPRGHSREAVLSFGEWLRDADASVLMGAVEKLRHDGRGFDLSLTSNDGLVLLASGWVVGGGAALRLRPAFLPAESGTRAEQKIYSVDLAGAKAILAHLSKPAFVRDDGNRLVFANAAYHRLAAKLGKKSSDAVPGELLEAPVLRSHLALLANSDKPTLRTLAFANVGRFELVEFGVTGGKAGYLRPLEEAAPGPATVSLSPIAGIIDVLATPIAIFDAKRELIHFNRAYCALWNLDPKWLKSGLDEPAILDRLRTEGRLPSEPDYRAWRKNHLSSYELTAPRDNDPWHLPDGRTINVISAPAGPQGGVIYAFEDISERLKLESQNKAMSSVQRETLNALSEGVAVFGTNGRLTLSNPRLSSLWKLPMNELGKNPHIDKIAEVSARAMPEDGAMIWRDLKRRIIDLNPTRSDTTGRINRADGRLLDYAVTRLPDGQTMMTFLDVTESANFQRMLKERNEALITADTLKDAFVQNVSYELRSPLTNIIGFADLLASEDVGTLNARQRSYTDYIRASSVTLGVLIDNILDLATVDAGIAELRPELQNVNQLVDKARAGLAATFPEINGDQPLNLVIDIPDELPTFVADGTRIVQVLYNLLSNAARFSEPGGEIRLSVYPRGERMLFIVEDEGPGFSEEVRATLLGRPDAASSGRQRGDGLGLAIVKTFVNLHGGTLSVERREARGTRVIVNLPLNAAFAGAAE